MVWKEGRKEVDRKETRSKQATNLTNLFTGIADTISNGKIWERPWSQLGYTEGKQIIMQIYT